MPITIHTVAEQIRQGHTTSLELVEACLKNIERYEKAVQAWVFVDADGARAQAKRAAEELKHGHDRGPLHGIPLGIKDIFDVFDWPTAAGSKLWENSIARADATVVKKLRQAGAIFLGKTVTTQYASFDPPKTRNPWNHDRTPGGSSSGSAAAVACGMCLGSLGSQTGGSITRPASYCGIAGIKPTYGRVALGGVVPLAPSMDHPGPIASCVKDLALLLQVIAGADRDDATTDRDDVNNYCAMIDNAPALPPRLGLLRGLFSAMAEPAMHTLMDNVQTVLKTNSAQVIPVALPAAFSEVLPRHRTIMAVEAAAFHKERLHNHPDDYLPNIRALLEEGLRCPAPDYARCKEHQQQLKHEILQCFETVDALLVPATRGPAPDCTTTGDPAFNSPWSYTGLPAVSIPAGWSEDGLPLAIQLIGPPWQEGPLLATAAWCERVIGWESREPKSD